MNSVLKRRPSPSVVISVVALAVAMSGTAVAAGKLAIGDNLIRKESLSGNRLRNRTLTAAQINLAKLGTVPSAASARQATSAGYAINATNATDATSATNALELGGQPASSYLTQSDRIGTPGVVTAFGTEAGATVTLFTQGPFTVTMTCTRTESGTAATLQAGSTEAGSVLDGTLAPVANVPVDLGSGLDLPATTSFNTKPATINLEAPSGAQAILTGADGVNSLGADCWANFAGVA